MYASLIKATITTRIQWKCRIKVVQRETWNRYIWTTENVVHGTKNTAFEIMKYLCK